MMFKELTAWVGRRIKVDEAVFGFLVKDGRLRDG